MSTEDHHEMIEDCLDRESRMSDWEEEFIESLEEWLANGKTLTERQAEKLEDVWERVTKNG